MSTRTYRGKEIGALLDQIRREHGEDARILQTRELKRDVVEIDIAIDYEAIQQAKRVQSPKLLPESMEQEIEQTGSRSCKSSDLRNILESQGLSARTIQYVTGANLLQTKKLEKANDQLSAGLSRLITIDTRFPFQKKFVAFVGPTGVGKTTTIAKLAARMRLAFQMKIALISADFFRVGAGYQLQTYASLMHLPCRVLDSSADMASELAAALKFFKDYDLVLIDAAGFSAREREKLAELEACFHNFKDIERMLLLPAPGNTQDLLTVVKAFLRVGIQRTVITKLDESGFIGPVIEAAMAAERPMAFFTTGQRVPEDIEPASVKRLAWRLLRTVH